MNIPTELAEAKTETVKEADAIESKFVTLWNSYKPQIAALVVFAFSVGFLLGHIGRHVVHVTP